MSARRELATAVALALGGGAVGLLAGSRPWVELRVLRDAPLPPAEQVVTGGSVSPLVPGLALVVLAAAAGLLATRRWGRVAVGLLVLAAGVGLLVSASAWLGTPSADRLRDLAAALDLPAGSVGAGVRDGPAVALVAAGLSVAAGALTVLRCRRWPAMGVRYERPSAPGPSDGADGGVRPAAPAIPTAGSDRAVWDALDRGEDPTARR